MEPSLPRKVSPVVPLHAREMKRMRAEMLIQKPLHRRSEAMLGVPERLRVLEERRRKAALSESKQMLQLCKDALEAFFERYINGERVFGSAGLYELEVSNPLEPTGALMPVDRGKLAAWCTERGWELEDIAAPTAYVNGYTLYLYAMEDDDQ